MKNKITSLRMGEKLRLIRTSLGLTQKEIAVRLVYKDVRLNRHSISGYELGKREPSSLTLFAYAKLANVFMDVLIDDALDLPGARPRTNTKNHQTPRKDTNS